MKKLLLALSLALIPAHVHAVCVGGYGSSCPPDIKLAEPYLAERARVNSGGRMKLLAVSKTDGREMNVFGEQIYELHFAATVEITQDCWWSPTTPKKFFALPPERALSPSLNSSGRISKVGERATIPGVLNFRKYESGWRIISTEAFH